MADFYVIADEKTGLFYDGRFGCTTEELRDTLARFVSVENATKDIKANRRNGRDVSTWRICGIKMVFDGAPIKPDLGKEKSGFVIECVTTGPYGAKCYWRGNKKAVEATVSNILHSPRSAATASVFETEAAAEAAVAALQTQVKALKKQYANSDQLRDIFKNLKFNIVKV